jgi:serine/threonine-protein kinase RsbW
MDVCKTIVMPGQLDSLDAIGRFFQRAAEGAGLDARGIYAVELAVEEACTNIIKHTYKGEGRQPIECSYCITDQGLTITLRDRGPRFDPASVPDPDLATELQERNTGGLGMHFIRTLMDVVHFDFAPGKGNTLTMVKHRQG